MAQLSRVWVAATVAAVRAQRERAPAARERWPGSRPRRPRSPPRGGRRRRRPEAGRRRRVAPQGHVPQLLGAQLVAIAGAGSNGLWASAERAGPGWDGPHGGSRVGLLASMKAL